MADDLDHLQALKKYIEDHEDKRRKRAKARPGSTRSTMATINHSDLGKPLTVEQLVFKEIVEWDSNLRDLNAIAVKDTAMVTWLLARVAVLETQRIRRWELWTVLLVVLGAGGFLGLIIGARVAWAWYVWRY